MGLGGLLKRRVRKGIAKIGKVRGAVRGIAGKLQGAAGLPDLGGAPAPGGRAGRDRIKMRFGRKAGFMDRFK